MALLHSLQLCGIRSFSPDSTETINFNSPVTLFLGHNGCGKTTIIESICFALSGELPSGSSGGQGFLNDPKMTNKRTTKGVIKIKFYDTLGHKLTMCRSMTVTAKQDGKYQFKRMDSTIRKKDKDDSTNIVDLSGRIKDIDNYCATALNVSKAILNNVLFCHQENSTWPLDEGQKLKEKFDKIFEAERYNKCIEVIRKYLKDLKGKTVLLKERLASKEMIKNNADRLKAKSTEKKEQYEDLVNEIANKDQEMVPMNNRWKEILDLENSLSILQQKLTGKEAEMKGIREQQESIRKHISVVFEGSDEELQNKIDSFEAEQNVEKGHIAQMERSKLESEAEIKKLALMIQKKQMVIGQYKEGKKQYEKKLTEYNELTKKLRLELELPEFGASADRASIIKRLKDALETRQANYKSLEERHESDEKSLQKQIDDARVIFASTIEKISSHEKSIRECNSKVKEIKAKLDELDTSDSQLRSIENRIEKLQVSLKKYKESFNEAEKLQEIDTLKDTIKSKDQELDKLEKEYRNLQKNYVTEQKLESLNTLLIEKQREVTRIMNKHSEMFKKLFSDSVPEKKLKESVEKILLQEDIKTKSLTTRINKLENEKASTETKLNMNRKSLENEKRELAKLEGKVTDLCKGRPYEVVLLEAGNNKEKLQREKGNLSSIKIMYEQFAKCFEEEPCCPICKTDFSQKTSMIGEITTRLRAKVWKVPSQMEQAASDLKKAEDSYNKLQQLKPIYTQMQELGSTKIPKLEAEIAELQSNLEETSIELFSEMENIKSPQELVKICKTVISDAALFDQYNFDIAKARASIEDLQEDIVKVPSNRSRQEAEAEIERLKSELSTAKNKLESAKDMLDNHKERCQNYNKDIQNETQKQINIQMLMNEKPLLEKEQKECQEKLTVLNEDIEQLGIDRVTQEEDLKSLIEQRQNFVRSNKRLRQDEQNKLSKQSLILSTIVKVQSDLTHYETSNSEEKLDAALDELATMEVRKEEVEKEKNDTMESISRKKQSLAKRDTEFRALSDNVLLRDKKKLEDSLNDEIKQLKGKIGQYNFRSVYDEKLRLEKQIEKVKRDINLLKGKKEEVKQQIHELQTELDKPQNKNAYSEHHKQVRVLFLHDATIRDITVYANVLEQAVLQFHKERMVQINRIIRDLWRSIYKGNDIDYIEIKNDSTTGSTSKRAYNYSVVQVKNNIELEMRGRCSAGQKVLACLVIRMALAETFSSNCGILALDEPTTNLDRENIHSLGDALSRIVASREKESNFQLLIITHDEEFMDTLTRVQSLESYYKVKRNNNGFSMIEKCYL